MRAAVVALAVVSTSGCYKPNITDGGFLCALSNNACPDGYTCGADHHCWINPAATPPPPDSGPETSPPMSDAGDGGEAMCMVAAPLCADGPAAGDACSPSCQKGCACGRCNVVDGKPKCTSIGSVQLGEVCTAGANDNCAPGLICLIEACGNGLARCYRHCTSNSQCAGTACTIGIDDGTGASTPYSACDVPPRDCDPINATGCPNPALNCYLNGNVTLCDCPTKQGGLGATCSNYSECDKNFTCIALNGEAMAHCRFVCNVAAPACPNVAAPDGGVMPASCVPAATGAKFGYCN